MDAGEVLEEMLSLGGGENQRRVFYSRETTNGTWAEARQSSRPPPAATTRRSSTTSGGGWRSPSPGDTAAENAAETRANAVINETYALKQTSTTVTDPLTGNPVPQTALGAGRRLPLEPDRTGLPHQHPFFAGNVPGYRTFAEKHRLRRKLLLVGANDGMLHAFDAGIYRDSPYDDQFTIETIDGEFDNGSGREVFAYIPRAALPVVRQLTEGSVHRWAWTAR